MKGLHWQHKHCQRSETLQLQYQANFYLKITSKAHNTKEVLYLKTTCKAHNTVQFSVENNLQRSQYQSILYWKQLAKLTAPSNSPFEKQLAKLLTPSSSQVKTTCKFYETKQFSIENNLQNSEQQAILYLITTCNAQNTKQFSTWKKLTKLTTPSSPPLKTTCKAHNKWGQNSEPFLGSHKTTTPYNCPHKDNAPSQKSIKLLQ